MRVGICPRCEVRSKLTKHHYRPKRHFGRGPSNKDVIYLCRPCHNLLEDIIVYELMPVSYYYKVVENFLK